MRYFTFCLCGSLAEALGGTTRPTAHHRATVQLLAHLCQLHVGMLASTSTPPLGGESNVRKLTGGKVGAGGRRASEKRMNLRRGMINNIDKLHSEGANDDAQVGDDASTVGPEAQVSGDCAMHITAREKRCGR